MVLSREHPSAGGRIAVVLGIVAAVAVVGATLLLAERVSGWVPPAVTHFLTRVLGLLLAAIGVELIVSGIRGAIEL
jgi:small neutral amino acid transporter SnatA (MarC family)